MPALAQSHPSRRGLIHTHPVVAYFLIAYAFSWLIGGVLIASYHGLATAPTWLHYVSAFGPTAAAIIVTAALDGRVGLMDLWQRVVRADVGLRWWLVAAGTPLALAIVAAAVYAVEQSALPDIALFGEVDYLGNIGALAALGLWIATYGFGEEIGWRGFALHRLQSGGWVRAAVMIGVLWGLWHLPYFFYKDTFIALGIGGFAGYLISIVMGSILLSWIYCGSGNSILMVALWHGLFDFVSASPVAAGGANAVLSIVVVTWVIIILWRARSDQRVLRTDAPDR
ncbi:MAG: CPBP family intramembrane glutamic endopeptidase [Roseiflexaceae bacterium]|nr:CPBP family intramembrane metalloprotease [Roseiflexus sp.]MDW8212597.1 CPBP family intramembrane glutamic endopeptidase [Roseiflexaceae bacterium]